MKTHSLTTHYLKYTRKDGVELELELPFRMSEMMAYYEVLEQTGNDQVVIGYLVDDSDCANPLTDCDGMGRIFECRRNGRSLRDYERVCGLKDGGPDYELVEEGLLVDTVLDATFADEDLMAKALEHCNKHWDRTDGCYADSPEQDAEFIRSCLDTENELAVVIDIQPFQHSLWCEGRLNGTIGDKHAVMLDVHEHGQVSYQVNSGGRADFDVARGGAVWVPDDCAREEILRRATTYRKGYVKEVHLRGETWYEAMLWASPHNASANAMPGGKAHANWGDAFNALSNVSFGVSRPQEEGEAIAAQELAKQAAATYTDWCNGNCFGVVVVTYDNEGTQIKSDETWGFIGDDNAYDSLKNDYFPKEEA